MNRAYALNRDKVKCRVCGEWLISCVPYAHRINPNLPLNKVNSVNNLVSLHTLCFEAVNDPRKDLSGFAITFEKKLGKIGRTLSDYMKRWGMSCQRPAKRARKQNPTGI